MCVRWCAAADRSAVHSLQEHGEFEALASNAALLVDAILQVKLSSELRQSYPYLAAALNALPTQRCFASAVLVEWFRP